MSKYATIEQDTPNKVPILLLGDLNTAVIHDYVECCEGYFDNKDIPAEKQVCMILARIKDYKDWIRTDCPHIQSLTFLVFIAELCRGLKHSGTM
jgi:hypothetical protein